MIQYALTACLLLAGVHAIPGRPDPGEVVQAIEVPRAPKQKVTTYFVPLDKKTRAEAASDFGITAGDVADAIESIDVDSNEGTAAVEKVLLGSTSDDNPTVIVDTGSLKAVDCENTLILSEKVLLVPPYYYKADPVIVKECKKAKADSDIVVFGAEQATSVVDIKQFVTTGGKTPVVKQSIFINTEAKLLSTSAAQIRNVAKDGGKEKVTVDSNVVASGDKTSTTQDFKSSIEDGVVTVTGSSKATGKSTKESKRDVIVVQKVTKPKKKKLSKAERAARRAAKRAARRAQKKRGKLLL